MDYEVSDIVDYSASKQLDKLEDVFAELIELRINSEIEKQAASQDGA